MITGIIRRDLESGDFNFGVFLYRRVRRLYPALIATLALALVAGWYLFLPYRLEELALEIMLSLLYVVNIYFWQNIDYFGLQANNVPLLHMWSLAVEEQFYFLFPIFCILVWRVAPKLLFTFVCLGALVSFCLGVWFSPLKPEAAFYLLPTRAWELLVGAILALLLYGRSPKGAWLAMCGPVGLILVVSSVVLYGPLTEVPGWFALLPTLGAVALITGGYNSKLLTTRFFSSSTMVFIGKISYPLYLVHWPIRIFIQEHTAEFTLEWRLLGFAFSFVAAVAIYYLIELPLRNGQILKSVRSYVVAVLAVSAFGVGLSGLVLMKEGVPSRFPSEVSKILEFRSDLPAPFKECVLKSSSIDELCRFGSASADVSVLVIGDSHAQALAGVFDIWLEEEGLGGVLAYRPGCMPVVGSGNKGCRSNNEALIELARESDKIQTVIFVSIWRQGLPDGGKPFNGEWVSEADVPRVFAQQLSKTVLSLTEHGKKVVIVEPLFAAKASVPNTLAANIAFGRNRRVDLALSDHLATFAPVFAAFDSVTSDRVQRLSLIEPFCTGGICKAVVDGRPLFTDNNHLAFSQSAIVAKALVEQ